MNSESRGMVTACRHMARRMVNELDIAVGKDAAAPATLKLLEVIAALERLDNELVERA